MGNSDEDKEDLPGQIYPLLIIWLIIFFFVGPGYNTHPKLYFAVQCKETKQNRFIALLSRSLEMVS